MNVEFETPVPPSQKKTEVWEKTGERWGNVGRMWEKSEKKGTKKRNEKRNEMSEKKVKEEVKKDCCIQFNQKE